MSAGFISRAKTLSPRGLVGLLADVVSLATAIGALLALLVGGDWASSVLAACLGAISLTSLAVAWKLEIELRERDSKAPVKERLADSMPNVAKASDSMARATLALTSASGAAASDFVLHCEVMCQHLARAFEVATGRRCRVTMQETFAPEADSERVAAKPIAASYPFAVPVEVDWTTENTDFDELMEGKDFYLCNDLVSAIVAGYKNSHWTKERLALWQTNDGYPYKAVVVWPIRGLVPDSDSGSGKRWDIRGFLSVDSVEPGTFDADTVISIGETITSIAYAGLVLYRTWDQEELWQE